MQGMDLDSAVEAVVTTCPGVRPGEDVVVVAHAGTRATDEAVPEAARAAGGEATLAVNATPATGGTPVIGGGRSIR
jgi:hypothetical protein